MKNETPISITDAPPTKGPGSEAPYGATEMRLNARQWLVALAILTAVAVLTPLIWARLQHMTTGPDYRIPYQLSNDYWLYNQRLRQVTTPDKVVVIGDSVIWGEYVSADGTLPHFLNKESGVSNRFVNAGVNGLFPLALEGLIHYYGQPLRHQKVIVHCNLLWMTSKEHDLSTTKEVRSINHARLLPQFSPQIPCYKAGKDRGEDVSARLSAIIERNVGFFKWTTHLQAACFNQMSVSDWTLEKVVSKDGKTTNYPNVYRNPLAQLTLTVPSEPSVDPERGPMSSRHISWLSKTNASTTEYEWVPLADSLQWGAFQRLMTLLRERGNDVLVVIGPFNEHMLMEENRPEFRKLRDGVAAWLEQNKIPHIVPQLLPSELYADGSHPLTEGYALLAAQLYRDEGFKKFCTPAAQ